MEKISASDIEGFSKKKQILVLVGLCLAGCTPQIAAGAGNILLPTALTQYGAITMYAAMLICQTMGMAAFSPIAGKLSDIMGSKRTLSLGLVIYFLAMLVILLGNGAAMMAVGLFAGGIGYGAINACVKSSVSECYTEKVRPQYLGYIESASDSGMFFAPLIGGIFTDTIGWKAIYAVCFIFALSSCLLISINMPKRVILEKAKNVDYKGLISFFLLIMSMLMLISGVGSLVQKGSMLHYIVIVVFVLCAILFVVFERRNENAFISFELFKNKLFVVIFLSCIFLNLSYAAGPYYSFYYQNVCGYSAIMAGSLQTPKGIIGIFVGVTVGTIATKTGNYNKLYFSQLFLVMLSYVIMAICTPKTAWLAVVASCIQSCGMGAIILCPVSMVMRSVDEKIRGTAIGLVTFTITFGSCIGTGVAGKLMNYVWGKAPTLIPDGIKAALTDEQLSYLGQQSCLRDMSKIAEIQDSLPAGLQAGFADTVERLRMQLMSGITYIMIFCTVCMIISIIIATRIRRSETRIETVKR